MIFNLFRNCKSRFISSYLFKIVLGLLGRLCCCLSFWNFRRCKWVHILIATSTFSKARKIYRIAKYKLNNKKKKNFDVLVVNQLVTLTLIDGRLFVAIVFPVSVRLELRVVSVNNISGICTLFFVSDNVSNISRTKGFSFYRVRSPRMTVTSTLAVRITNMSLLDSFVHLRAVRMASNSQELVEKGSGGVYDSSNSDVTTLHFDSFEE